VLLRDNKLKLLKEKFLGIVKFKDEWDELCPIFIYNNKNIEQVGTGVLIDIWENTYLLTASHVVDLFYIEKKELYIPTKNGFELISGTYNHSHLIKGESRINDNIDFSFFKLSTELKLNLVDFKPLQKNKINLSIDFTLSDKFKKFNKLLTRNNIKNTNVYLKNNYSNFSDNIVEQYASTISEIIITFAGYPISKSKSKNNITYSEIFYYHGGAVEKSIYKSLLLDYNINIIAQFGKHGSMGKNYIKINPPKKNGISGGGIYKIIKGSDGFHDRELIGIGHTKKDKQHLLIGTNINYCLSQIYKQEKM
jgi:hypothetical protein